MTILHLIFSFNLGGAETMLIDIANRQALSNNVQVYVINNEYCQQLLDKFNKEVTVHLFKRKTGSKNLFKMIEINCRILLLNPDIIHCHDSNIIKLIFVHYFFKTILTVHDLNLTLVGIKKYNKVIAISSAVKDHLLGKRINNIAVVYNGIDISSIQHKMDQQYHQPFRIIQVSRLDHLKKGQHLVLEALRQLVVKYKITNFHLDFIGEGNSLFFLQDLVHKYSLEDKVSFLGIKDRSYIYSHLKEYDLLIQPSVFEGFGLTVVEGMAANLPVLVSANDGPIEIIMNGQYGYFFNKEDTLDCTEKIKMIIESPEEVHKISMKGYEHVLRQFDINATVRNYQKQYDIVTQKRSSRPK